jgi:hypothetical protein
MNESSADARFVHCLPEESGNLLHILEKEQLKECFGMSITEHVSKAIPRSNARSGWISVVGG